MDPLQITSVIAVLRNQNKFLLVQRALTENIFPGKWQNLGGKVELGETIEQALIREAKEEVGIEVFDHPVFLQSYSWKKNQQTPIRLGLIFLINLNGSTQKYKIKLNKELSNYNWFTFNKLKHMDHKDLLIGKGNNTGTLGQIQKAIHYCKSLK